MNCSFDSNSPHNSNLTAIFETLTTRLQLSMRTVNENSRTKQRHYSEHDRDTGFAFIFENRRRWIWRGHAAELLKDNPDISAVSHLLLAEFVDEMG